MLKEIQNIIIQARSKKSIREIAQLAIDDESILKLLLKNIRIEQDRSFYTSSWALCDISEINHTIFNPHIAYIFSTIQNSKHPGLKRNLMKLMQFVEIPNDLELEIGETCLSYFKDQHETIAVRAYSVTILEQLIPQNMIFNEDVLFEIERQRIQATPALNARTKRYLKKVKKLGIGNFTNVFNDF